MPDWMRCPAACGAFALEVTVFPNQWKIMRYNSMLTGQRGWIALDKFAGVAAFDTIFDTRDEAVLAACFEIVLLNDNDA